MLSRKKTLFLVLVVLLVVGGLVWFATRPPLDPLERQRQADIATLKTEGPEENEYFGAVTRLSQEQHPLARQVAIKNIAATSEIVREGSVLALGRYDDVEALESLTKLANDPSQRIRLAVINALGQRGGSSRRETLQTLSKQAGLGDPEKIAVLSSLLKTSRDDSEKQASLLDLLLIAENSTNPSSQLAAIAEVSGLGARHPSLVKTFRTLAENGRGQVRVHVIAHLGAIGDEWIRSNYTRLLSSEEADLRRSVVRALPRFCPSDRWTILESVILRDRDRSVAEAAFQAAMEMPGEPAENFFKSLSDNARLAESEKTYIEQGLAASRSGNPNPCDAQKGNL
jgi:HEAT repeat protein